MDETLESLLHVTPVKLHGLILGDQLSCVVELESNDLNDKSCWASLETPLNGA